MINNASLVKGLFNIFTPANYTVRNYDDASASYVADIPVRFLSGLNNIDIPLNKACGKYLRMDLFKENTLVHFHDFEKNK